jgi:hypothetical protein
MLTNQNSKMQTIHKLFGTRKEPPKQRVYMQFLPKGYQAPKSSNNYMKFQAGENKFRILSTPVIGWEDWQDKRPIRFGFDSKPSKSIDPKKPVKHFWAMIVWNYSEEQIQILHLTQTSIREAIETLVNDENWGAPYCYDIKVFKTGEKIDTEYKVTPVPHKALDPYVIGQFTQKPCNLEAIFTTIDPFDKSHKIITSGQFGATNDDFVTQQEISSTQVDDLKILLMQVDDQNKGYYNKVVDFLRKHHDVTDFAQLKADAYNSIYTAASKKLETMNAENAL